MKIVDLGGIDVGERSGEDVRLFLVVALQTDEVGGPNHRFKEIRQIHDFDSLARSVPASVGEALRQGSLLCVPALHSWSLELKRRREGYRRRALHSAGSAVGSP